MCIKRFSFTLYQHYFPADGERSFGEDLGKVGERMGKELGKGLGRNYWGRMGRWELRRVMELRIRQTKKRTSKISLQSSLMWKKAATYSPALHCSTIGASGLNFSVRNGKRWDPVAITTWYNFQLTCLVFFDIIVRFVCHSSFDNKNSSVSRIRWRISTSKTL